MKFGFYVSKNATRFALALQENILSKENTAFALTDYSETQNLQRICSKFEILLYNYSYEQRNLFGKERNIFPKFPNIFYLQTKQKSESY